jgi:hypothetical protein
MFVLMMDLFELWWLANEYICFSHFISNNCAIFLEKILIIRIQINFCYFSLESDLNFTCLCLQCQLQNYFPPNVNVSNLYTYCNIFNLQFIYALSIYEGRLFVCLFCLSCWDFLNHKCLLLHFWCHWKTLWWVGFHNVLTYGE